MNPVVAQRLSKEHRAVATTNDLENYENNCIPGHQLRSDSSILLRAYSAENLRDWGCWKPWYDQELAMLGK